MPASVTTRHPIQQVSISTAYEPYHCAMLAQLTTIDYLQWSAPAFAWLSNMLRKTSENHLRMSLISIGEGFNTSNQSERYRLFYQKPEYALQLLQQCRKEKLVSGVVCSSPPQSGWVLFY